MDRILAVERVGAVDAVHVDVDEPGHDQVPRQLEVIHAAAGRARTGGDIDDLFAVEDERARTEHAIGQHDIGAREDDHATASAATRAAPMATPSSASGEIANRT